MLRTRVTAAVLMALLCATSASTSQGGGPTQATAERMARVAATVLQPVYAPLAEYIVERYGLAGRAGIGIDVGGGPGQLVVELGRRTPRMEWINADYNPHFRDPFRALAHSTGLARRVRFASADVHALPFPAQSADVIVSRGSFPFWRDLQRGLGEIYRVLKPGGVAYIGRGFSANLPVSTARSVRARQGAGKVLEIGRAHV